MNKNDVKDIFKAFLYFVIYPSLFAFFFSFNLALPLEMISGNRDFIFDEIEYDICDNPISAPIGCGEIHPLTLIIMICILIVAGVFLYFIPIKEDEEK